MRNLLRWASTSSLSIFDDMIEAQRPLSVDQGAASKGRGSCATASSSLVFVAKGVGAVFGKRSPTAEPSFAKIMMVGKVPSS